jgi:hypothetical protein
MLDFLITIEDTFQSDYSHWRFLSVEGPFFGHVALSVADDLFSELLFSLPLLEPLNSINHVWNPCVDPIGCYGSGRN